MRKNWPVILIALFSLSWFSVVFSRYPLEASVRADATIKYEKALQWWQSGSFFYEYPQSEFDPQKVGVPLHLSGVLPHLAEYAGKQVITYPESFAILVGLWISILPDATLALLAPAFVILELLIMVWLAARVLRLPPWIALLGGVLLLFCTPHYLFSLQLQEVGMASCLMLAALSLMLGREGPSWKPVLAGVLAAVAFSARQEAVFFAFFLCVALLLETERSFRGQGGPLSIEGVIRRNRSVLIFGLVFLAGFLFYLWYNWILYDAPLGSRYYAVQDQGPEFGSRWHIFSSILVGHFDPSRPVLGLLAQMPFLLLLLALPFWWKSLSEQIRVVSLTGVLTVLSIALFAPNDSWGGTWGQRFTMVIHGPLILSFLSLLVHLQNSQGGKLLQSVSLVLLSLLVGASFWLAQFGWKLERENLRLATEMHADLTRIGEIPDLKEAPVLSADDLYYWAGLQYWKRPVLRVGSESPRNDLDYYLDRTRKAGLCCMILRESVLLTPSDRERMDALKLYLAGEKGFLLEPLTALADGTEVFHFFRLE